MADGSSSLSDDLRAAYHAAPFAMVVASPEGEVLYMNPAALELLGGGSWRELGLESDVDLDEAFAGVASGAATRVDLPRVTLATTGSAHRLRLWRARDGRVHAFLTPASRRDDGDEAAVRKAVDELPVGVTLAAAKQGTPIVYANRGFRDLSGYTQEDLIGRDFRLLHGEATDEEARSRIGEAVRRRSGAQELLLAYRADGTTFWNRMTVSPIHATGGEATHIVAIHEDVSMHRKTGEELQLARRLGALGELAGGLAHDMRNVLTGAGLVVELLTERNDLPDDVLDDLREIGAGLRRGASVTDRLLAFAREHTFEMDPIDLGAVVAGRRDLLATAVRESIRLEFDLAPTPVWVLGNEGQIDQMLINVARNAEQAMPSGGRLELWLRGGVEQRELGVEPPAHRRHGGRRAERWAVLGIRDEGVGMPEEVRIRAFEPFFTTRKAGGGTGLGLASVYGVMQGLGGMCWIESEEGVGTTVYLAFPEIDPPAEASWEGPRAAGRLDGVRILLAEDDDSIRRACARFLESRGAAVEAVPDGAAGRERLDRSDTPPFDLLITDAVMPGLSGPELIAAARERDPELPCILASGYTLVGLDQNLSGVRMLEKPFSMSALLETIDDVLRRRTAP